MFTLPLPCSFYHSLHTVTPSLCGSSTFGSPTHITHHPLILISEKREKPEFERRNLKWSSCFTYTYICIIFFCMSHLLRETFNPYQSFPKPVYFYFHPSFLLNWMKHIAIFYLNASLTVIKKEIEKRESAYISLQSSSSIQKDILWTISLTRGPLQCLCLKEENRGKDVSFIILF